MAGKDRVSDGVCTVMRGLSPLLVLVTGLVLAAPAAASDHPVTFMAYAYSAPDLSVAANDTVTFSGTFVNHPLVWTDGDFTTTGAGGSRPFAFPRPGTYAYYCQLHGDSQNMRGVVRVPGDQHPAHVGFVIDPAAPQPGQPVTFTYAGDPDPDGTLVRWRWDLDGDGSLETTTTTPSATHTYAVAGALTARVQAIDDGHEASAVAEQVVTIAAPGSAAPGSGASGGSAGSGGAAGSRDTTAPRATLVKLSGLKLSFHSSERATATATVRARGKTIARGSAKAAATTIRLRLTSAGRSMLLRGHKLKATLTLTLRDTAGNRRSVKKTLTVKRA
jgi:plastocyanin